jgi:hypothetical protein
MYLQYLVVITQVAAGTCSATLHPAVQYLPKQQLIPYDLKAEWFMGMGQYSVSLKQSTILIK